MPVFFQQQINDYTRLGIWKIEETEDFFKNNVPQHRDVTHPHKRLQHLAGRFLLQYLFPAFPYELVQIADTRKPFLPDEQFHFSISHCGDYASAIVSSKNRVGIDIEIPTEKVLKVLHKFISPGEREVFTIKEEEATQNHDLALLTLIWSLKEAVFKWYGDGSVDFKEHIHLKKRHLSEEWIGCHFTKTNTELQIQYRQFKNLMLAWVIT